MKLLPMNTSASLTDSFAEEGIYWFHWVKPQHRKYVKKHFFFFLMDSNMKTVPYNSAETWQWPRTLKSEYLDPKKGILWLRLYAPHMESKTKLESSLAWEKCFFFVVFLCHPRYYQSENWGLKLSTGMGCTSRATKLSLENRKRLI